MQEEIIQKLENGLAGAFKFEDPRVCDSNPTWFVAKRTQKDAQANLSFNLRRAQNEMDLKASSRSRMEEPNL